MNFFQNFEETKEKEYYECTDTMAQMKNKTNETKNVHSELYKCNHASQWVYVGVNIGVRG